VLKEIKGERNRRKIFYKVKHFEVRERNMASSLYSSLAVTVLLLVILSFSTATLPVSRRCKALGSPCYEGTTNPDPIYRTFVDCCSPSECYCDYSKPLDGYPGTCVVLTMEMWNLRHNGNKV